MYVSHLVLRNWKNFKNVEAPLQRRMFLIGPNASGKSNFLDVFRFLRDVADIGLRRATEERGGVSAIRCLAATRYSNIDIEVHLTDTEGEGQWAYSLSMNQDQARRPTIRKESVRYGDKVLLDRPTAEDEADSLRLTQTALEQINANQEFRPVAEFFRSIAYQHLLPQVVRDPRSFSPVVIQDDPYGRDFLLRIWRTQSRTRDSRLRKITRALQSAVPQLSELRIEQDENGVPHLVGRYEHWREHPARQDERQFSDGTLRLFGLLWTIFEGDGPLLLEEPELSLHPEVVRRLPAIFHRINRLRSGTQRQILISTHSQEMLQDEGVAPEEVLRLEPTGDGTILVLPDEADRHAMRAGLTAADVLLPKSAPRGVQQLLLLEF